MQMVGLYEWFEKICMARGEKTALICEDRRLSYSQLLVLSETMARNLYRIGIHKGTRVALLFKNSVNMLGLYFALLRLGALTSPLNYRESLAELAGLSQCVDTEFLICANSCF